jgi:hypothetical protein
MPLAFESKSHGTVAFGFFNIDSDMLLLEDAFFFATDFCAAVEELARAGNGGPSSAEWPGYRIASRADVGDLMGAIHGVRLEGFIGEIYRRFPFPSDPESFRQKPEGEKTRAEVEAIVKRFARQVALAAAADPQARGVTVAGVAFTVHGFHELLRYVWRGGYPRWKDDVRPACAMAMRRAAGESRSWAFAGISFG